MKARWRRAQNDLPSIHIGLHRLFRRGGNIRFAYQPKGGRRNTILGTLLVCAGLGTALTTIWARRQNNAGITGAAAIASLVIAALLILLVLPPLASSARAEVSRLELPFEVTSGGAVFLAILMVTGFAAWNTGNNLLFMVFSLLVSTLLVSWNASRATLRSLVVQARFPDHIFAGERAPVIVTLRNRKRVFPSLSILVETLGPRDEQETSKTSENNRHGLQKCSLAYFTYVRHDGEAEQRVEQLFEKRGHVLITGFELSTRFPFGFFRRRRRLGARNVDLIVYPKPEPIGDDLHLLPINAGRNASARLGGGHDLLSLRDYQPQDNLRHIDWKATARARRLTVRQFAAEDERRVTIALDTLLSRDSTEQRALQRFEHGVIMAASLLAHFTEEGAEVRLALGSSAGRFGSGQDHFQACLRRLALVEPARQFDATDPGNEPRASSEVESYAPTTNGNYVILLTTAHPGSIPSRVWRTSHVIYL